MQREPREGISRPMGRAGRQLLEVQPRFRKILKMLRIDNDAAKNWENSAGSTRGARLHQKRDIEGMRTRLPEK
jgi:hypothetical protein